MTIVFWDDRCSLEDDAIVFKYQPQNSEGIPPRELRITFQRTIRVPDNVDTSKLPPGLGVFPLLKVRDYASKLPQQMVAKGGVFMPMYQKESMWICFEADEHFMIKIYAGGVNVISGEHFTKEGTEEAKLRRQKLIAAKKTIQDYVVVPEQLWLDGIAVAPGVVKQFVAMPVGEGYSVEAQLTGREVATSLQFEITPIDLLKKEPPVPGRFPIFVRSPNRPTMTIYGCPTTRIDQIKSDVQKKTGIPPDQQIISFMKIQLEDYRTLSDYSITKESNLTLVIKIRGGSTETPGLRMAIAAGGKIEQNIREVAVDADGSGGERWSKAIHTLTVQILNSRGFRRVTGRNPPPCPINASTYAAANLPYFKMFEEPSAVAGDFGAVLSVNEIEQARGLAPKGTGGEASVHPRLVALDGRGGNIAALNMATLSIDDPDALLNPDGPLLPFRTLEDLRQEVESESGSGGSSTYTASSSTVY